MGAYGCDGVPDLVVVMNRVARLVFGSVFATGSLAQRKQLGIEQQLFSPRMDLEEDA